MVINASRKIWELACGDMYRNDSDSYGCPPPVNITKQIDTRCAFGTQSAFGGGIYSEYQIQKMIVIAQRIVCMFFISQEY